MSFIKDIFNRLCLDRIKNRNIPPKILDIIEYTVEEKLINYECIICLDEFNVGETLSLIKCGHMYHTKCLYTWFLKRQVCPLCDEQLIID